MPRLPRIDVKWLVLVALAFSFALPLVVCAVPTIMLGTYDLQPNTPNQSINVYVSGGDAVNGVNLEVTTGDGGVSGNFPAPVITGVNLFPVGGVFTGNNTGTSGYGQATGGQYYEATTTTQSGYVNLGTASNSVLLATITFTTAAFSYTYNAADPQEQSFSTPEYTSGSYSLSSPAPCTITAPPSTPSALTSPPIRSLSRSPPTESSSFRSQATLACWVLGASCLFPAQDVRLGPGSKQPGSHVFPLSAFQIFPLYCRLCKE